MDVVFIHISVASLHTDTSSLSSQEAFESSQGLQQASMVLGHNEEGILPLYVAVYVKPNKGKSLKCAL